MSVYIKRGTRSNVPSIWHDRKCHDFDSPRWAEESDEIIPILESLGIKRCARCRAAQAVKAATQNEDIAALRNSIIEHIQHVDFDVPEAFGYIEVRILGFMPGKANHHTIERLRSVVRS